MSVRQSLGKVAVVPKGSWDGTKTYEFLDIVKSGGGSYIARQDVPIGIAITNTEYWVSLADKGGSGDDGVSPDVTVTEITGGHRVTITDKAHPHGQSFDVMDGDDANVPTKLSQFTNDAGFVTAQQAAAAAPVQSVNGKTGAVEINDVPDYSTTTTGYVLAKTGANTLGWIPPYDPSSPEYSELQEWLASDAPDDVSEALLTYLTDNNLWQDGVDPAFYAALTAAARAGKLPNVTAADNGKIAIASNGAWTVGQAPVQSVNGRTGAVTVNEVPDASGASVGQVLSKTENGLGWTTPSGGGGGAASLIISLYLNSQTGVYTCSASPTQLYNALPNCALAAAEHTIPVTDYKKDGANYVTAVFVDPAYENDKLSAIVWTLTAATSSSTVTVTREEVAVDGVPDSTSATVGQVLTKAQDGPRWANNNPSSGAALRLLYDGAFGPDDPDLMLMGNVADAETGNAIATALYYGRIGSAVLVDVTDPNTEVVYDLFAVDYDAQTHVSTVVFARTEGALIRTATLSGSTKAAPVFGTLPLGGLPTVSASDNGKFLRVVSGAWAAQAVPIHEPRVAMTASDTTPTLDPNKLYVFPEMASLAITLATPTDNSIVNEYHFIFTSGATATTLTLPAAVLQPDGFTVDADMVYEVSIVENCMTAQGWAVTA